LFDIDIHYVGKIDFGGFEKLIDALGGITIDAVEIHDPKYPKDGTYDYEPFNISAGVQEIDGKTALKYVRSRGTSSDFDRSNRQQDVLLAIKEKALGGGLVSNASRFRRVYSLLKEHIETNMDLREMISLAQIGAELDQSRVFHFRIHDDPSIVGGFLYTPLRELYGGAYVLLPASDKWDEVRRYVHLIMAEPEWLQRNVSVQILNGSKRAGVATSTKVILQRYGLSTPRFGNAREQGIEKTILFVKNPEISEALPVFEALFDAEVSYEIPLTYLEPPYESETDIVLEIGEDFLDDFDKLDVFRNVFDLTPKDEGESEPEETPET
jgi:polyisoprenyl-teichoic acid--peptidoglycan teichoic acid transferase